MTVLPGKKDWGSKTLQHLRVRLQRTEQAACKEGLLKCAHERLGRGRLGCIGRDHTCSRTWPITRNEKNREGQLRSMGWERKAHSEDELELIEGPKCEEGDKEAGKGGRWTGLERSRACTNNPHIMQEFAGYQHQAPKM